MAVAKSSSASFFSISILALSASHLALIALTSSSFSAAFLFSTLSFSKILFVLSKTT